jgi:hypothetical protein
MASTAGGDGAFPRARVLGEHDMINEWRDLFQWDRFITPSIVKSLYWLAIVLVGLWGLTGIFNGLAAMALNPFAGFIMIIASLVSIVLGIVASRVAAEFVLIVFRINEHLGAIRDQGERR